MDNILDYLVKNQTAILEDLQFLVNHESPSNGKEYVDRCGNALCTLFQTHLGIDAEVFPQTETGDHLRFTYGDGDSQILLLAHMDTVWDVGRLSYHVEGNKAYGPGILDMKGGIIQAIWALKACRELGLPLNKKIVFLCTSDEEIGSHSSRELIEREALQSEAVLVLEFAASHTGTLKTARKGNGCYKMKIKGKAVHAGNHHADGISAVEEMAHQILYLHSLTDYQLGTTLNVGIANGGNRINVVAEQAEIDIDLRIKSLEEAERVSKLIMEAKPKLEGITLDVTGSVNRPPMVRTSDTERLLHLAQTCGEELGITIDEAFVGGGSDGNFTAALGVPTLDGLGAVGEGAHAENEHILIDQLPLRAALIAKMLTKLS